MTKGKSNILLLYYYLTSIGCCHTTRFGSCDYFDEFDISAWAYRPKDDKDDDDKDKE